MFTIDIQRSLIQNGDAIIKCEDDMLYFGGSNWLLASPIPATDIIPAQTAEFLKAFFTDHPTRGADMAVLTADPKSFVRHETGHSHEYLFQPVGGFRPTELSNHAWHTKASSPRMNIETASPSLFAPDLVDLTALWKSGDVQPFYGEADETRSLSKHQAETFLFRFKAPSGLQRLVHVEAGPWKALHALGLRAYVPADQPHAGIPPIGFRHADDPSKLFGFLEQVTLPTTHSDDGRDMLYSPLSCSWATEEWLLRELAKHHDVRLDQPALVSLDQILEASKAGPSCGIIPRRFRAAVDVLRWRGVSEEEISSWFEEKLPGVYYEMARGAAKTALDVADSRFRYVTAGMRDNEARTSIMRTRDELERWWGWMPYAAGQQVINDAVSLLDQKLDEAPGEPTE